MKRSNRLFLLVGIVLAVVAALGVLLLSGGGGGGGTAGGPTPTPAQIQAVVAASDLPLGTVLATEDLTEATVDVADAPTGVLTDPEQAVGRTIRQALGTGDIITEDAFGAQDATSEMVKAALRQGFRAIAVQVDQVSGVGTLIQPGDSVDVVLTMTDTEGKNPIVIDGPPSEATVAGETIAVRELRAVDELLNNTTVKVLVQNAQVLGTLLPPPPTTETGQQPAPTEGATDEGETALTGREQIAIIAVTPQQVELVRFAQIDGNLSLVLRSTADSAPDAAVDATSGITLRQLVDDYGVIPPNINLIAPPPPIEEP